MSIDYFPDRPIPFEELKDVPGIKVEETEESNARNAVVLFDGDSYVWAFKTSSGNTQLTRFGRNNEDNILEKLQKYFQIDILSEYEVQRYREELSGREY